MKLNPKLLNLALILFGVCALGLASLTGYSQEAPIQDTHGIAVSSGSDEKHDLAGEIIKTEQVLREFS